jgi:predicted CXXCH cytochrome family protein
MNKTFVALAVAFFASTASAAITNSAHDFVNNGYVVPAPSSACIFCHVPHGGQTTVAGLPLWAPGRNLTNPTAFYSGLRNGTIVITSVDAKGTQTCLGCHATGAAADMGTTTGLPPNASSGRQLIVGTDISNDHPVGDQVIITFGANGMQPAIVLGGLTLVSGVSSMQCSTCHDVHNTTAYVQPGSKLLRSYTGDFCIACHNK